MSIKDLETSEHFPSITHAARQLAFPNHRFCAVASLTINPDGTVDVVGIPAEHFEDLAIEDMVTYYLVGDEVGEGLGVMVGLEL